MFKLFLSIALLAVLAIAVEKTPEEARAELLSYGLSEQAADGLIRVGTETQAVAAAQYKDSTPNPMEAIGAVFKLFADLDAFIKTQSPEDQAAYNRMMEQKKAEFEAQFKNGGH